MKASRIVFHPAVSDDLAEAAEYFIETVPGRVDELLADYDRKLEEVIAGPHLYGIRRHDALRRANLDTFSCSIRYDWTAGVLARAARGRHHRRLIAVITSGARATCAMLTTWNRSASAA